jgi:OpgC protein
MGAASDRSLHPLRTLASGAVFLYQPRMLDILPMYCIFFFSIPLTLEAMMRGKAWLVGLISGGLWLATQWGVGDSVPGVAWIDLGAFNVLAWQAYFNCRAIHRLSQGDGQDGGSQEPCPAGGVRCDNALSSPAASLRSGDSRMAAIRGRPRPQPHPLCGCGLLGIPALAGATSLG